MPVDVRDAFVAAEREDVHPLRAHFLSHRFGNLVDEPLQVQIIVNGEIARYLLPVLFGSNQRVAVLPRISVEEGDGLIVLVDDVLWQFVLEVEHDERPASED